MQIRLLVFISFIYIFFQTNFVLAEELYISKNVDFADQLIEKGATNTAYFILKNELKNKHYATLDKYNITKLIARCFLKELDFAHYDEYNTKAYQLVKNKEQIYKAQYFIERVYFFHHLTWQDSVVFYAKRAKQIFYANKKDWKKINVPFFYQIYAISHIYANFYQEKFLKNKIKTPLLYYKIFQYYDSAIYYNTIIPYRKKSDLALLYRGIGNRHLDLVSTYNYPKKINLKKLTPLSLYCYNKAKFSYTKANSLLDTNNIIEKISNYSLLALNEMCLGKITMANIYFDSMHSIYEKNKEFFMPNSIYLSGLTYERMNDFNNKFNLKKTQKTIKILESFIPKWLGYITSLKAYSYDIYSYSPFFQLFCQYSRIYFNTHKKDFAKKALVYLINEKLHFKKLNNKSNFEFYRLQSSYYEMNRLNISSKLKVDVGFKKNKNELFTLKDLNNIMRNLKNDEAIIFTYRSNDFLKNYKVLLTQKNISFIRSKELKEYTDLKHDKMSIKKYKEIAFKAYYNSLYPVFKFKNNLKKLYVLYDDDFSYEKLISRQDGRLYSDLKYVLNKISVIKLYDFESYFNKPTILKKMNVKKILLANNLKADLPFMFNFKPDVCNHFEEIKINKKLTKSFDNDQIIHFIGHGNNSYVDSTGQQHQNKIIYSVLNKQLFSDKLTIYQKVKSPLIILNNCYSGVRVSFNFVYDKGIYLQLMKQEAKNVIVSSDKIDDYVSSKIMKYFYSFLHEGIPIGESLVYAKRKFLKENKNGYANPMYWSPFFSISSRRVTF